jgi:hypothetical protein
VYVVRWAAEGEEEPPHTKNITEHNLSAPHTSEEQPVRVLIGDLMPGVKYLFEIHTVSYHLHSDITKLAARTSKFTRPCLLKFPRHIAALNLTAVHLYVSFVMMFPLYSCYIQMQHTYETGVLHAFITSVMPTDTKSNRFLCEVGSAHIIVFV